jgi:hypothetical protein
MTGDHVSRLLERFRESRRAFQGRLDRIPPEARTRAPAPGEWSARETAIHVAAWLEEANDRIPRLVAGAPEVAYDSDAFNAAAIARAEGWSYEQALAAFRRAADRFEAIVSESSAAELADEPPAMRWIESMAGQVMEEHAGDLERLIALTSDRSSDR